MILASVDGFFQFLPKLVEEKVSSGTEKTGKNHGKNHPLEETANPVAKGNTNKHHNSHSAILFPKEPMYISVLSTDLNLKESLSYIRC